MTFSSLNQNPKENIQDYLVRLRSSVVCPSCNFDISNEHIKDQFICELYAEFIQTDILANAVQLKALDDVIKHAEALETAACDQQALQNPSEVQWVIM